MKKNKFILTLSFMLLFSAQIYGSQVWKSMILPGCGENSLGYKDKGRLFLLSEYVMWSSLIFADGQYDSYRSDYRSYGTHYANVDWNGKNDLFAAHVGNHQSLYKYNLHTLQDHILAAYKDQNDADDRDPSHEYYWNWEDDREKRLKYDGWRNKSENYDKAKGFIIAGIIINRIISVVDVLILERKNTLTSEVAYDYNHTASLNIHYNF